MTLLLSISYRNALHKTDILLLVDLRLIFNL
jgi:hypothetical protein